MSSKIEKLEAAVLEEAMRSYRNNGWSRHSLQQACRALDDALLEREIAIKQHLAHLIQGPTDEPALMAYHMNAGHGIAGIGGDVYDACLALLKTGNTARIDSARRFDNARMAERFAHIG